MHEQNFKRKGGVNTDLQYPKLECQWGWNATSSVKIEVPGGKTSRNVINRIRRTGGIKKEM